ncbi:MAG: GNAT family N-acetyltransferase [Acidimicrobiia bacterium]|nr:GNAT family N-acetyltransferase [Acidimicrobiia bacterium]
MDVEVRNAFIDDADVIAKVHVDGWEATYRGVIDDDVLDRLTVTRRSQQWAEALAHNLPVWIADHEGKVVGFTAVRADELSALYVSPEVYGQGIGTILLAEAERQISEDGISTALLWVHEKNTRSQDWYEKRGWKKTDELEAHRIGDLSTGRAVKMIKPL